MKKKITAMILALAMTVGLAQGAFAAEPENGEVTEEQIQAEIQARTEEVYDLVYAQMEAQDAVDMVDAFMDILIPEIEFEIILKYSGGIIPYDTRYCNFAYGGVVTYKTLDGREVVGTYYDIEDTAKYLRQKDMVTVYDIVISICGGLPKVGGFFTAISVLNTLVNAAAKKDIDDAGGYARIISINDPDNGFVTGVFGWPTYPMSLAYNTDNCIDFQRDFFPEKK